MSIKRQSRQLVRRDKYVEMIANIVGGLFVKRYSRDALGTETRDLGCEPGSVTARRWFRGSTGTPGRRCRPSPSGTHCGTCDCTPAAWQGARDLRSELMDAASPRMQIKGLVRAEQT